jgi:DNA-binding SARP family transcriptional activator/TolB-like protein/cytochrome c-type biogenesis protein CcmH/NrfG
MLRVLGELAAGPDETCRPPIAFSTRKVGALLSVLALSPRQSASREHLASLLWGNRSDQQARQSLRQALVLLRKDVRPYEIVEADAHTVRLRPGAVWVDALELEALAECTDFGDLQRAMDLFRGEFLAGLSLKEELFENWLQQQRRRFEAIGSEAIERFAARADSLGRGRDAIAAAERLLAIDPLREDRQRLALELYARHRGPNEALAQAEVFARLLQQELSVEPEAKTRHLVEQIRQGALARAPQPAPGAAPQPVAGLPGKLEQAASVKTAMPGRPQWPDLSAAAAPWMAFRSRVQSWLRSELSARKVAAAVAGAAATAGLVLLLMHGQSADPVRDVSALPMQGPVPASGPPHGITMPAATATRFENGVIAVMVLPFTSNGSASEASGAIASLITDELTTTLSSAGAIRVISRETARTFHGQTVDAARMGAELGVAYLLEGSASTRGNRLRVNIGLVETATGLRVWSRRFDRSGQDRLAIQDEIINGLCRELQIEVIRMAGERGSRAADVHSAVHQGWSKIYAAGGVGKSALQDAEKLFSEALDLDPGNTRAQLGLAGYHVNMAIQLFAPDPEAHLAKAETLLHALIERRPHMASAYALTGVTHYARGRLPEAKRAFERAIELSPSHAPSYAQLGRILLRLGQTAEALAHIHYAIRLSPRDPHLAYWLGFAGSAELELEHFDKAVTYFEQAAALNPTQPRIALARSAAHALAGNMDTAYLVLQRLQREQPHLSREKLSALFGKGGAHNAQLRRGLELVLGEPLRSTAAASTPRL